MLKPVERELLEDMWIFRFRSHVRPLSFRKRFGKIVKKKKKTISETEVVGPISRLHDRAE